ncbi:MAG: flavin reductase family protein [Bacteroidota bacterium]|nr:flavin reductase family protein [Candidatus Kapabacteria bacterium]MCS7302492.1 flavin reductase family protein [Candidatus Kapabacteria bacterium]MCX7937269.1 flavin reductase family protein [Chlorobiota bacterium]MDW8075532.1 flavin reductase family protein [Bacteroidota bacterium]MDW8271790.1 flavin reductase family protein [Bacteroidota bacterium]
MITYDPSTVPHAQMHGILLSGVAPRPIAFVASRSAQGDINLAPFSFFNAFASKPPVVAIGPAVSVRSGKVKDTWRNILETGECTISVVTYGMLHQMNLAAAEYPHGTDEFVKAGLTKVPAETVDVPYVGESPFVMECRLVQNIELFREEGGNGNIMLLRVHRIHVKESVLTEGKIDPRKMDLVARMGYHWYARVTPDVCFELPQPGEKLGIGVDALPEPIRTSPILTGNDLGQLASVVTLPTPDPQWREPRSHADSVEHELIAGNPRGALDAAIRNNSASVWMLHRIAHAFLEKGDTVGAWQTLYIAHPEVVPQLLTNAVV